MPELRIALLLLCLTAWEPSFAEADFVGSGACQACHEGEFASWTGSHHQEAMLVASERTVLGDFDGATFEYAGVTSRFFRKEGKYLVNTDAADGSLQDFEITYTFGVYPLQQYLVGFPDGRYQALGIAWDSRPADQGGQRWFHVYSGESIAHDDPLHWTGPQQNWNFMCADCHSTNLEKKYQPKTDQFATTWSEISVGCEACHGPGSDHISWAGMPEDQRAQQTSMGLTHRLNERSEVRWVIPAGATTAQRSEPNDSRVEIEVCATCHSRRGILREGAAREASFLDHYMPALLSENLYHADGQILDEVYVWGSFLQSRMYSAGVTCSDCHDPHSQQLKLPGDAVCAQCHQAATYADEAHHHHPGDTAGARCANCHMPETTYMVVDPRRDHSMRIPRPNLSLEFSTPNACNQCHRDRSVEWAAEQFESWYPGAEMIYQSWTGAFAAARAGDPTAGPRLAELVVDDEVPDIARATAVLELRPYLDQQTFGALQAALRDDNPLLRMAAARALDGIPATNALPLTAHLLQDDHLAVRGEAARILAGAPRTQMNENGRKLLDQAISDYIATQELNADRSENLMNLGNLYMSMDDASQAERYFRQALDRESDFVPAWVNLAELYRAQGMNDIAVQTLRSGLEKAPDAAALHHSLGLALIRLGQQSPALASLTRATELAPGNARFSYVMGIALNSAGQPAAAIDALKAAHQRHQNNQEILFALATIHRDLGQLEAAREWAEKLLYLNPGNEPARALLGSLGAEE